MAPIYLDLGNQNCCQDGQAGLLPPAMVHGQVVGNFQKIIKFKGNARYRHYIKFFGKYRRVLDRTGSAHVELPLHFNTAVNKIEAGTLKVSKIKIKNKFIDIVLLCIDFLVTS